MSTLHDKKQELMRTALSIPLQNAIEISAYHIGISLDFQCNNSGKTDIVDHLTGAVMGFISDSENYCSYADLEVGAGGNQLNIANYFLNSVGDLKLSKIELAKFLVGQYRLEDEEFNANLEDDWDQIETDPTITLSDFLDMELESPGYLVDALIPDIGVSMLHGAPGTYKTFFYIYIISCILSGKPVFGEYKTKPTNVLIINTDDPKAVLQNRLATILPTDCDGEVHVWHEDFKIDEDRNLLEKFIGENGIGLIVIDTLRQIHQGDENDSGAMSKVMNSLKAVAEAQNCAIMVVHHDAKDQHHSNLNAASGSIATIGDCICTIRLRKKGTALILSQNKNKIGKQISDLILRFDLDGDSEDIFTAAEKNTTASPEEISQLIKDYYFENPEPGLKKDDVVRRLSETEIASKNGLDKEFDNLVEDGFLSFKRGPHGIKIYFLASQ